MAIERDAVIRVKVQGAQQAEAQLDGVSGGLDSLNTSAAKTSQSAQKAGRSLAQAGEAMEQSLKPIDSTFKGFDRINGILGQLTNATRILSGVAFVELGASLVQLAGKAFQTEKSFTRLWQSGTRLFDVAEKIRAGQLGAADAIAAQVGGTEVLARLNADERRKLIEFEERRRKLAAQVRDLVADEAQAARAREVAQRNFDKLAAKGGQRAADAQNARDAAAATERIAAQALETQRASLDEINRQLGRRVKLINELRGGGGGSAPKASARDAGRGGAAPQMSDLAIVSAPLWQDLADAIGLGPTPPQAIDGTSGSLFGVLAADMALAAVEADALTTRFNGIKSTAEGVGAALGTVSTSLSAVQGGLSAAGVESEALVRIQAGVQAGLMAANSAAAFADGLKAAAGSWFSPPNPVQAAANFIASAAYATAAVAYGAAAAGAGGGGGGGGASGVNAAPSPGAYGSATAARDAADAITINVNSPGAAFLSRSERQRLGTELGGMMLTAMGARGSGLRAGFRRELGGA